MKRLGKQSIVGCLLAVSMVLAGCGSPDDAAKQSAMQANTTVTIGYVNWSEDVAVTHLMKNLLTNHYGYNVKIVPMDAETAFQSVADGSIDAFLDVWLPKTHADYWAEYGDQVVNLGSWYAATATLGLAVPDYVDAQSITDLNGKAYKFGGKIVGINPNAGIMELVQDKVIPAYGLGGYTLTSKGEDSMIKALDTAIHAHKPIVITAWKPHWMFTAYPIRYLKDPKGTLAGQEHLDVIVRNGLKKDMPVVYKLFDNFRLTETQLGTLELDIDDARSVFGGVNAWLRSNKKVVAPWLTAATEGRGEHPL